MGAQGQWMFHRFGKRDYPKMQIDIKTVIDLINSLPDLQTLRLHSIFGDSLTHTELYSILNLCKERNINVVATTYGHTFSDRLSAFNIEYNLKLAGIKDKANSVFLKSKWNLIRIFLRDFDRVTVNFDTYQHNTDQIPEVSKLCGDRKASFNPVFGNTYQDGVGHVIDERGYWLYDLHVDSDKTKELIRTAAGYSLLKKYPKKQGGVSILSKDCVIPSFSGEEIVDERSSSIFVSVTGHVFNSYNHFELFSNALCTDWSEGVNEYSTHEYGTEKRDSYIEETCDVLRYLHSRIDDIDLSQHSITDILGSFDVTTSRRKRVTAC
jgi:hypothetical protein